MSESVPKGIACFDMDMTLFDHKTWAIPESALRALERLRERYYIVIATGRDMDAKYSRGMTETVRPDAIIHLNGTKITVGDRLIYEHRMDQDLLRRLLTFVEGKPFAMGITTEKEDYYMNPEYVTYFDMKRWKSSDRCFRDPWKLLEMPVRTMAYIGGPEGAALVEEQFPELKLPMFAGGAGADVIEKEASKAEGLKRLCAYYQVPMERTVAFGDSMNDYEIVVEAGLGVAMGNGHPELKKAADYVTTDIDRDGIWNACVHLGLFGTDKS